LSPDGEMDVGTNEGPQPTQQYLVVEKKDNNSATEMSIQMIGIGGNL